MTNPEIVAELLALADRLNDKGITDAAAIVYGAAVEISPTSVMEANAALLEQVKAD